MYEVAEQHRGKLEPIKKAINNSHNYFKKNVDRYNEFNKFVFDTAIDDQDQALLLTLKKPVIEFNIQEMFISRLRGEFSKQEPAITIQPDDGAQVDEMTIKVIEGHIRHAMAEANNNNCQYDVYTDILAGGFSVLKIWTEYAHEMSFDQVIKFGRAFDPTLCGFDPMARYSHKGDGRWCFEFFPKSWEDFHREYPNAEKSKFTFLRTEADFNWSYKDQKEDVVILCDFYEKKKLKRKIVKLANGQSMLKKKYKAMLGEWREKGIIEQPPAIIAERQTTLEVICRYRVCENDILEYEETEFKYLPLIFVDGNSRLIRDKDNQAVHQMCRPYTYHARGAQKLKNFAGQTLAAEIENMVMHKFKVAKESLPEEEEYLEAYGNMQIASTFVYNAFMDNDPDKAVPPPQEIQRTPCPPEIKETFMMMDSLTQTILGSFDAALGINDNQLSGVAIVEGATQSNAAAMPYVVGFMQAWNQLANSYVSLLPKYYITPRTIPVLAPDGKRTFQRINDRNNPQSVSFNYDENALNVRVEAGVSFAIQKSRALQQLIALMQISKPFDAFMTTEGLDILLDNVEFKGVEVVRDKAKAWMDKMKQAQEAQANAPNPDAMKAELEEKKLELENKKLALQNKEIEAKAHTHEDQIQLDILRIEAEKEKLHEQTKMEKHKHAFAIAHNIHSHQLEKDKHEHQKKVDIHTIRASAHQPVREKKK